MHLRIQYCEDGNLLAIENVQSTKSIFIKVLFVYIFLNKCVQSRDTELLNNSDYSRTH